VTWLWPREYPQPSHNKKIGQRSSIDRASHTYLHVKSGLSPKNNEIKTVEAGTRTFRQCLQLSLSRAVPQPSEGFLGLTYFATASWFY